MIIQHLRHACINSDEVHCIYIYSSEQFKLHNEANCKVEFIISNLIYLSENLKKINIPLTIIDSDGFGDNPIKILEVVKENQLIMFFGITHLELMRANRDHEVKEILDKNNIINESFDDQVVYAPGQLKQRKKNHTQCLHHLKEDGLRTLILIF